MGVPSANAMNCGTVKSAKRGRGERGAEVLEFALVFTVLMMLLMGIVTFARAYNVYQSITRAAREGARMAVLPSSVADGNTFLDASGVSTASSTVFQDYIKPALQAANLNPSLVSNYSETVGWLDSADEDPQCGATISFKYPYTLSLPFTRERLTTVHLSTQVQMRRENQDVTQTTTGGVTSTAYTCP